jgi:hypothetical protein
VPSCGGQAPAPTSVSPTPISPQPPAPAPVPVEPPPTVAPPLGLPEIFVGAGDIGACDENSEATARLLDSIGGTVFTLGDNAYPRGAAQEYRECYDPTWGRHKARTRPSPGNHEYESADAAPYFDYFGASAGPPGLGYYSFDLGTWHVVSLNSNVNIAAQVTWLQSDLEAHRNRCTVAYWHHALYSSGIDGPRLPTRPVARALQIRCRRRPQQPQPQLRAVCAAGSRGTSDPVRGCQFVVGTGARRCTVHGKRRPTARSDCRIWRAEADALVRSYDWEFVSVSAMDSGVADATEPRFCLIGQSSCVILREDEEFSPPGDCCCGARPGRMSSSAESDRASHHFPATAHPAL